jgi:WD40 repeat protein
MYKVFLSSTSRDLTAYREAVHRAIDRLDGFILVKMEDFGARDETARDLCARLVGESQVLVGLLGHYYGSRPSDQAHSFTELEYRAAVASGLPRLMFFAPDDFPIPASLREPDESFQRQKTFRARVMAERVGASFDTPEQLASVVTTALANWRAKHQWKLATPSQSVEQEPTPESKAEKPLGPNPYRGLEAFRKEDADRFLGREALVEGLWQRFLELHRGAVDGKAPVQLLAILGASGSGKSSVAQAGLLAELDRRPLPGRPLPPSVVLTPQARPLESLAVALARLATGEVTPAHKAQEFEQVLHEREGSDGLRYLAERMLGVERAGVILLVDQFEEVFSLCDDLKQREAFIGNLMQAARGPGGRVSIILTLRSDFLGEVNRHPELSQLIAAQNVVVPVMGEANLRRAIEEPAKRTGREIDPGTVELLIEQTEGREGALPLLEFVLTRIWDGFGRNVSAAETVRALRGVGGALAKEAQDLYDSLDENDQAIARRAFLAMVQLGEGTRDTRRRASLAEMVTRDWCEHRVLALLRRFSQPDRRLISLSDLDGQTAAEVTHEALFDHWRPMKVWLDEERDDLRFERRLSEAVAEWDRHGKPGGLLWRPPSLDLLRSWREKHGNRMNARQMAFADKSEAGQRAEKDRERRQAEERQALLERALRTQSLFLASISQQQTARGDATNGMLLALEALRNDMGSPERRPYVAEAEAALYAAVMHNREIVDLQGHAAAVRSTAFSRDSRRVVTASNDGTARLWDTDSGKTLVTLQGHTAAVWSAAFSVDGTRVVTASNDNTARLWDAGSGIPLIILRGHTAAVWSAVFSQDDMRVVTASADCTARLWNASSGEPLVTLEGHTASVWCAALSQDGTRVITTSRDNTARLWNAASGQLLFVLEGHTDDVLAATFSADGARVITASGDHTARLWDAASGEPLFTLEGHTALVLSAAFNQDGTRVVTASADGTGRLWDTASGKTKLTLQGHAGAVWSAVVSQDGRRALTASEDNTARLWDTTSGKTLLTLEGHKAPVLAATFSQDGTQVVTACADGTARLWGTALGKTLLTLVLQGHTAAVRSAAFSQDGTQVVTASDDRTVVVWDAASGVRLVTLQRHTAAVGSAAFNYDGTRVVTACLDHTARLWNATSGEPLVTLQGHAAAVWSAELSQDGTRAATASDDKTARLWDAASGKTLVTLQGHTAAVWSAAFSQNGTRVITASADGTARVWDTDSGKTLITLQGHTAAVWSAAFSQDGMRAVTASNDGTARLWDGASGDLLVTLVGHKAPVTAAAFSQDGTRVVTASRDHTARLWDAASGKILVTLEGHKAPVLAAAFSKDGTRVITASADRTARLWLAFPTTQALIDYATSVVPRQLTPEERTQFFLE